MKGGLSDRRRGSKVVALVTIWTFVLIIILPVLLLTDHGSRNAKPVFDDTDLSIKRPSIPPEDNAFTYLCQTTNYLYWPTNRYGSRLEPQYDTNWNVKIAQDVVDGNAKTFAAIRKGLECSKSVAPAWDANPWDSPPYLSHFRQLAKLMMVRTSYYLGNGRHLEAIAGMNEQLRCGDLVLNDEGGTMNYLVGLLFLSPPLLDIATNPAMAFISSQELRAFDNELARIDYRRGLEAAIRDYYRTALVGIRDLKEGKVTIDGALSLPYGDRTSPRWWHKTLSAICLNSDESRRMFAELARTELSLVGLNYADAVKCWSNAPSTLLLRCDNAEGRRQLIGPNPFGKIFFRLYGQSRLKHFILTLRTEALVSGDRLMIASMRYHEDKGKYPPRLNALVPDYMERIPRDPFDGKEMRYIPDTGVIYSVSEDMRDSGGSTNASLRYGSHSSSIVYMEDMVFTLPPR